MVEWIEIVECNRTILYISVSTLVVEWIEIIMAAISSDSV